MMCARCAGRGLQEPDFPRALLSACVCATKRTCAYRRSSVRCSRNSRSVANITLSVCLSVCVAVAATGLYQAVQQPAPYMPPSVAAIPSDVLHAQHRNVNLRQPVPLAASPGTAVAAAAAAAPAAAMASPAARAAPAAEYACGSCLCLPVVRVCVYVLTAGCFVVCAHRAAPVDSGKGTLWTRLRRATASASARLETSLRLDRGCGLTARTQQGK